MATRAGWPRAFNSMAIELFLSVKCSVFVAPIAVCLYCNITICDLWYNIIVKINLGPYMLIEVGLKTEKISGI
jgi:hypothetical protein